MEASTSVYKNNFQNHEFKILLGMLTPEFHLLMIIISQMTSFMNLPCEYYFISTCTYVPMSSTEYRSIPIISRARKMEFLLTWYSKFPHLTYTLLL